jgi:hypothetical protein
MKLIKVLFLCSILISAACSGMSTAAPEKASPVPDQGAYPMGVEEISTQEAVFQELAPTWTPDASLGQVTGQLLLNGKPVSYLNLYLGGTIKDAQGLEFAASLDRLRDPTALTGKDGNFHFMNVPPGRYVLILDDVTSVSLLMEPEGDQAVLLTIESGEVKDLGVLDYDDLPIVSP